jgi:hypothetical protein
MKYKDLPYLKWQIERLYLEPGYLTSSGYIQDLKQNKKRIIYQIRK